MACSPLRLVTPATVSDLAEAMTAAGHRNAVHWGLAKAQLDLGRSWAMRGPDGVAVAAAGLVADTETTAEAWFVVAPGVGRRLAGIVRAVRLTLSAAGYRSIRAVITTPEGARLARLAGFTQEAGVWVWQGGPGHVLPLQ